MGEKTLLDNNYIKITHIASKCMRIFIVLIVALWCFSFFSGNCNRVVLSYVMSAAAVIAFIPTFVIDFLKYDKSTHIKYIVIAIAVIDCTLMNSILSHTCLVVWIFPILISSLYYNRTLVLYASLFSIIGVLAANLYNFYLPEFTVAPIYNDINDQMLFTIFPCVLTICILSFVAYFIVARNSDMLRNIISSSEEMKSNQKELIFAFAELSESKSKYTGEHIKRVAEYMKILGEASGFDEEYVDMLSTAAMMHDIGKLMIPEEILDKPGRLTDEEFAIMKSHVLYGDALLEKCPGEIMKIARIIAKEHHEKWDGTGYLGMKGEEIAYISRLMSVCDVFDALTSERYYKRGWSLEETYNEIVSLSGRSFDPKVVELFKENFDKFKKVSQQNPDKSIY